MSGSQTTASEQGGGASGGATAAQLPDPANATIEEESGKGKCIIRYIYTLEKGDVVEWTLESDEGSDFRILFTVKRLNSEKVVYLRKSKVIPGKLRENIVVKKKELKVRKGWYEVQLEKKADFNLAKFFQPDSPPV